jgi:transposase InsO family protein
LQVSDSVQETAVFDVFLLPDEGLLLEHYQQTPFHQIRARGRSLGCLLYEHLFTNYRHVRQIIEKWRSDYNLNRPHTSLDGLTPYEFATRSMKDQS